MQTKYIPSKKTILGITALFLMPVISYLLFEYVTGNLSTIDFPCAFTNILLIACLYLAVFSLTGRSRIAIPLVSLFLLCLSIGNTFVVSFRGKPIMPSDVLALSTAMTVAGAYTYEPTFQMILAVIVILTLNVLFFFIPVRFPNWKSHLACFGISTAIVVAVISSLIMGPISSEYFGVNSWEPNASYESEGYILCSLISATRMVKKKPSGYSNARLENIYQDTIASISADSDSTAITPVNLICIMNESFSDLNVAGSFETNEDFMPFFHNLSENSVKGNLYVPVFGSGTSNTEFEFLTGASMAMMADGTTPYQFNVLPGIKTMVSSLKEQGFDTVAVHPYPASNWNRDTCYANMGFDEFLDLEDFGNASVTRSYINDQADYEKLVQLIEEKENPDDPLFIFNVTMQNHGGYDQEWDNFDQTIHLTGELEGKYPLADQFLSLMKLSDDALSWFLQYLSQLAEPTMVVLFGDHQPSVEDEFYYEISGLDPEQVTEEESMIWYETPYLIWANYPIPADDGQDLSACYLSSKVLELAGLSMTPYQEFLLNLSEKIPILHGLGCYDKEGTYQSLTEMRRETSPYAEILNDYEILVYNQIYSHSSYSSLFHLQE